MPYGKLSRMWIPLGVQKVPWPTSRKKKRMGKAPNQGNDERGRNKARSLAQPRSNEQGKKEIKGKGEWRWGDRPKDYLELDYYLRIQNKSGRKPRKLENVPRYAVGGKAIS